MPDYPIYNCPQECDEKFSTTYNLGMHLGRDHGFHAGARVEATVTILVRVPDA